MNPIFNLHSTKLADLRAAKSAWSKRLFATPRVSAFSAFAAAATSVPDQNVVGVGIGEQMAGDQPTGILAVKFFVRVKYPKDELSKKHLLPSNIDGMPVDVEQTGLFRRFAKKAAAPKMPNPKTKIRPAQPGCSCGYEDPAQAVRMAGTFGALVKDAAGTYILSNNHVLADEGRLKPGAAIYQPGLLDGGTTASDKIGELTKFIPFKTTTANTVDAAIAKISAANVVNRDVLHIGTPGPVAKAAMDMLVHKFGRTTSYTVGRITSIDTDVTVGYDSGNFVFNDQIIIVGQNGKPFSAGGDSGSLILERGTNNSVGLLFAGSSSHTIANHLSDVLKAFKVTMA
jgi:hypothetical protein